MIDDLTRARVRRAIKELPPVEQQIIRWLYGIGCSALSEEEVAARLKLDAAAVWHILSRALEEVGFILVSEVAA